MKKIIASIMILAMLLTGCASYLEDGVLLLEEEKYEEAIVEFEKQIEKENEDWCDRLAIEYWQLTNRIGKLEKALIKADLLDDAKELLIEQRKAMLAYQDVLFRRCFHYNIDLYKHKFTEC